MSMSENSDRRTQPRQSVEGAVKMTVNDQDVDCQLRDISISAISVSGDATAAVGATVTVDLPGVGPVHARVTRSSGGTLALSLVQEAQVQQSGVATLARALA